MGIIDAQLILFHGQSVYHSYCHLMKEQIKQQLKAHFNVFDLHHYSCPFVLENGLIYDSRTENSDRVIMFGYREHSYFEEGLFWLTSPLLILRTMYFVRRYGPVYWIRDPSIIFPTGKCSACGMSYGNIDTTKYFFDWKNKSELCKQENVDELTDKVLKYL